MDWNIVTEGFRERKSAWIYTFQKVDLIKVCERYNIKCSDKDTLDELRKKISAVIKETNKEETVDDKNKVSSGSEFKMSFAGTMIELFKKGNNWNAFEKQLGAFIALNNVEDSKKSALLITRLSSAVSEELLSVCENVDPLTLDYAALISKLSTLYEPKGNEHLSRFTFRDRKQKEGESIKDYMVALRGLVTKCKFGTNETKGQLKDQLISGVKSKTIRYELLKESDKTLDKLLKLAETVEMALAEMNDDKKKVIQENKQVEDIENNEVSSVHAIWNNNQGQQRKYYNKDNKVLIHQQQDTQMIKTQIANAVERRIIQRINVIFEKNTRVD
ncbi:uncharacterized protein LOC117170748 [Belonocnema kinseyi]|uniref:uncharacterized protein LOC117170748 n=1 Tax=Belonocnema kinseyi TaxID=2817044 RepID=UPI00143DA916|nr:uncharacterized protein LOC117170748 [Belonocnema kinseyi]